MRAALPFLAVICSLSVSAHAQAPPATGQGIAPVAASCKDGTDQTGPTRSAVCKGHGGIKRVAAGARAPLAAPAPGGGPGMVWVNSASRVYHCPTDRMYGTTKRGSYMTEEQAKTAGAHAQGGKACS